MGESIGWKVILYTRCVCSVGAEVGVIDKCDKEGLAAQVAAAALHEE